MLDPYFAVMAWATVVFPSSGSLRSKDFNVFYTELLPDTVIFNDEMHAIALFNHVAAPDTFNNPIPTFPSGFNNKGFML
jgi:hypothetical protein